MSLNSPTTSKLIVFKNSLSLTHSHCNATWEGYALLASHLGQRQAVEIFNNIPCVDFFIASDQPFALSRPRSIANIESLELGALAFFFLPDRVFFDDARPECLGNSRVAPRSRPHTNWCGRCMCGLGEIEPKVYPTKKRCYRSFPWQRGNKTGVFALLRFQAFQWGVMRRNLPRDNEARSKSLDEKPWVRHMLQFVRSNGAYDFVLSSGKSYSTRPKSKGVLSRSFFSPCREDLARILNQQEPTRFIMIFHVDHTCSWEAHCSTGTRVLDPISSRKSYRPLSWQRASERSPRACKTSICGVPCESVWLSAFGATGWGFRPDFRQV